MVWTPTLRPSVVNDACPLASSAIGPASGVAPSRKVTVPWPTGLPDAWTVAVNVTGWPKPDGFGAETSVVWLAAFATTWTRLAELGSKSAAPEYSAVIVWEPGESVEVVNSIPPLLIGGTGPKITVPPSLTTIVPTFGETPPSAVTVRVNVTSSPEPEGFGVDSIVVVVVVGRSNVTSTGSWSEMRSGRAGSLRKL